MASQEERHYHANFGWLCLANLLLTTAMFILFPILPDYLVQKAPGQELNATMVTALFGAGLFLIGPFNSYLMDAFKRKNVCILSMLGLSLTTLALYSVKDFVSVGLLRIVQGALYSLAQMALGSTILNDLSMSERRTKRDYKFSWYSRFGVPFGALLGLAILERWGFHVAWALSIILCLGAIIALIQVRVPFRAPLNARVVSLDRFWQPQAFLLFLNLLFVSIILGFVLSKVTDFTLYALMIGGFCVALIAQRGMFADADLRAEIVSGFVLIGAAMLLLYVNHLQTTIHLAFLLLGIGFGWSSSRFLLYFLKLSGHCQRGTLQQTYLLGWEFGICIGFVVEPLLFEPLLLALGLDVFALAFYLLVTHRWFLKHRDRAFKFREV